MRAISVSSTFFLSTILVLIASLGSMCGSARAQGLDLTSFSSYPMEELRLKPEKKPTMAGTTAKPSDKGRVLRGLIVAENIDSVDFMEIRRPPGRPMFLIMQWRYPLDKVEDIVHLPEADRQSLTKKVDSFIEGDHSQPIDLSRVGQGDAATWHCEITTLLPSDSGATGKLIVDSTADEQTTRLSISRIEQIFAAYSEILPPRRAHPAAPLQINLFGAMQQYNAFLEPLGLHIENPAVYIPSKNLLAAGSELSSYSEQLKAVRRRHTELQKESNALGVKMREYLVQFRKELAAGGFNKDEQSKYVRAAEARFSKEQQELAEQISAAERRNGGEFNRVTQRMFERLFHEAFHAYLENYVYPQEAHDVPRWLNEGLAQVFEGGQLESGSLRLDAPDAGRLKRLQDDLRSPQVLSLTELLSAPQERFLVLHAGSAHASQRYYLYSWGLAYYLAFRQPILETPALDRYVDPVSATLTPVERFEKLVGMRLSEFEPLWRTEMLKMKPGR